MTTINSLVEIIKAARANKLRYFGIRTLADEIAPLSVGEDVPDSYNWDWEEDCSCRETTKETLNGACAIEVLADWEMDDEEIAESIRNALEMSEAYEGHQKYLIGTRYGQGDYGNDPGEIIIQWAEVIAII